MVQFKRIPRHIGVIPDGNRRWALARGMEKKDGYFHGIEPATRLFKDVWDVGIEEVSVYIFTKENSHRPSDQILAFKDAFFYFLDWVKDKDVSLLVVGDSNSKVFPKELKKMTVPQKDRDKKRKLNFLVNYNWEWDLSVGLNGNNGNGHKKAPVLSKIGSRHVSKIDLVIRWGDRNRLSGFLPVQTAYADIFIIKQYWPDYEQDHLHQALKWYDKQDITMGG
jgi:undecaprenyl diphosphate synthase